MDWLKLESWIQGFSEKHRQIALSAASVIAGVAILIVYFQSGPSPLKYAVAEEAFKKWSASPRDEKLYASLRESLQAVPDLQKRHEAAIAQNLLNADRIQEAVVMANQSLSRVKEDIPYHASFAETSLLIEQGQFQKALESAVALKERMGTSFLAEPKAGGLLFLHNLLRIACLQQELKNRPGEKAAWDELESFLKEKGSLAQTLIASFSDRNIDLCQYIAERKKSL